MARSGAEPAVLEDPLLSTQRGPTGALERFNLEASEHDEHAIARASGDVVSTATEGSVETSVLRMGLGGSPGMGVFEVVSGP
jgi:hypothetical protein